MPSAKCSAKCRALALCLEPNNRDVTASMPKFVRKMRAMEENASPSAKLPQMIPHPTDLLLWLKEILVQREAYAGH